MLTIQAISPHVHALHIPFRIPTGQNTALERFVFAFVLCGERTWLIDTGVAGSDTPILEAVAQIRSGPVDLARILLTHGHIDHLGSACAIKQATRTRVAAHPAERHRIEDLDRQERERPVPGFRKLAGGAVAVDEELFDGERLELGAGLTLRSIHSPGHSPGSTAFFLEEEGILFTGDAVPVAGDMPVYDDPVESARSVTRLRQLVGVRTLLSSWDQPRRDDNVVRALSAGADVIASTHDVVRDIAMDHQENHSDPMQLTRRVVDQLRLPSAFANPMVARTVMGHWRHRERPSLFD